MRTILLTLIFFLINAVNAQTVVNQEIKNKISEILQKPKQIFELDDQENTVVFSRIDKWFEKYFDFQKAERKQHGPGSNINYILKYEVNQPISVSGEKIEGLIASKPFHIWYDKKVHARAFIKEMSFPVKQALPEKEVIGLAGKFITANNFCRLSEADSITGPSALSLRKQELKQGAKETEILTLLQRVQFKRKLSGMEVINSKQIVEIHPATKEILAYKSLNWTPVNEKSNKSYPYLSIKEVVSQIDSILSRSKTRYNISKVKAGMFQDEKYVFPVLAVYVEPRLSQNDKYSYRQKLIISLVKDIKIEKKTKPLKNEPQNIKK